MAFPVAPTVKVEDPVAFGVPVSLLGCFATTDQVLANPGVLINVVQLQAVLDNSPAVVYVKDLNGRYILVSRRFTSKPSPISHDSIELPLGH